MRREYNARISILDVEIASARYGAVDERSNAIAVISNRPFHCVVEENRLDQGAIVTVEFLPVPPP